MKTYTPWFRTAVPFYRRAPDGFPMMTLAFVKRVRFADVAVPVAVSDEPTRPIPTTNTKRRPTAMKKLILGALLMVGCGGDSASNVALVANSGTCLDMGILVIAAQTCTTSPLPETVTCQADGSVPGGPSNPYPVAGCTVDLVRAPGEPQYAATCVEACPQ